MTDQQHIVELRCAKCEGDQPICSAALPPGCIITGAVVRCEHGKHIFSLEWIEAPPDFPGNVFRYKTGWVPA